MNTTISCYPITSFSPSPSILIFPIQSLSATRKLSTSIIRIRSSGGGGGGDGGSSYDVYGSELLRKPVVTPDSSRIRSSGGGGTGRIRSSSGGGSYDVYGSELLRKPVVTPDSTDEDGDGGEGGGGSEDWVDWEDQILEDTVPLVGFVRMILHSGKYESGEKLSPEHEKTILERLLPHHPQCEKKIGCGVDYITIGYHPDFESSRCLFIVRKDGEMVDFSYWKCIKGLIKKNYPLYADSFILRHFRQRQRIN